MLGLGKISAGLGGGWVRGGTHIINYLTLRMFVYRNEVLQEV